MKSEVRLANEMIAPWYPSNTPHHPRIITLLKTSLRASFAIALVANSLRQQQQAQLLGSTNSLPLVLVASLARSLVICYVQPVLRPRFTILVRALERVVGPIDANRKHDREDDGG